MYTQLELPEKGVRWAKQGRIDLNRFKQAQMAPKGAKRVENLSIIPYLLTQIPNHLSPIHYPSSHTPYSLSRMPCVPIITFPLSLFLYCLSLIPFLIPLILYPLSLILYPLYLIPYPEIIMWLICSEIS